MADKKVNIALKQKEIKEKTKLILESSSNANLLVDLIESADTDDEEIILTFIKSVHKIFLAFLNDRKLMHGTKSSSHQASQEERETSGDKKTEDPEDVFNSWLYDKYLATQRKLLSFLHHVSVAVAELSLCSLMKFLVEEYKGRTHEKSAVFPAVLFAKIFEELVRGDYNMSSLIDRFSEYVEYDDIRFHLLKNIRKALENEEDFQRNGRFFKGNIHALLSQVKVPGDNDEINNFLVLENNLQGPEGKDSKPEVFLLKAHKKHFSKAWLLFLSKPLSPEIHKKVLLNLHTNVIPYMNDPKMLMDFLTDSYNFGGATSLLALNGLFILIHQYNLDYPDFYKKLYALLEPEIFHIKYQSRFFHLLDLFLSSTHLPAYLVAAFAKKLSTLVLSAPPQGAILAVVFIGNLLKRHPSCQVLIHRKEVSKLLLSGDVEENNVPSIESDPYNPKEPDPAKCNAIQSSLWELKTLQHHVYPKLPSFIEFFEKPLGKEDIDISKYFDSSYDDLFEKQCIKVTENNAILEYEQPKGFLGKNFDGFWSME
ncbi:nucleolar complex protein 4 homolog A-like [Actinia tenebrosa]|uniref:Nucleolar complex protein 4 homolog A-like n=1 Tax=Actinia tenebrosa TaxID=6105 RepID=A0A6P8IKP8_ACTTE|nr:nucleolar complex protein 4 homolog A-like [Actinia tenebrosa]